MKAVQKAWAAYHTVFDWYPLSSIKNDPEAVQDWINKNYVSGDARSRFTVVQITIRKG